ncbi:hypothetical protein ACFE04_022645 [Oxalis oulophora]
MIASDMRNSRVLSLFLALVFTISLVSAISRQNYLVRNELKRLNKPAVKSIKSSDGDIIDCIKLTDQPAFDHPLLKNHSIQLSPTFDLEWGQSKQADEESIIQLWHLNESCPDGTIPIRRTKKSDILRELSFASKNLSINASPIGQVGNEAALGYVSGGKYFGTQANIDLWNPLVERNHEYSKTQIWVIGAKNNAVVNSLETGWHVSPQLNGDTQTRFFVFWTNDRYRTGCYNLRCSGFVQVSKKVVLGGATNNLSVYGKRPKTITLTIRKDDRTGNWLLISRNELIGYWPNTLVPYLQNGASTLQWGGVVQNDNFLFKHTTTQMGSGHFSKEGYGKANMINNIKIIDENYKEIDHLPISSKVTRPECYDVKIVPYQSDLGTYFYFGGPGRNENCQ